MPSGDKAVCIPEFCGDDLLSVNVASPADGLFDVEFHRDAAGDDGMRRDERRRLETSDGVRAAVGGDD